MYTGQCTNVQRCPSDKLTQIYFLRLSNVCSILHHGSVGRVHKILSVNAFKCFFSIFVVVVFGDKIKVFVIFISFFWWSIKFTLQNINQLETRIGGFQPSLELYSTRWKQKTLCFVAAKNYYAGYTAQYWFILVIMVWCCCINFRNVNAERGTNSANYLEAVEKCRYS